VKEVVKRVVLHFPKDLIDEPIIYRLVKDFNLTFNILQAKVTPHEEGLLILELQGKSSDYQRGVKYLQGKGVKVRPLGKDIAITHAQCTQCGVWVAVCPVAAITQDKKTYEVTLDPAQCIACELCVKACPVRAIKADFVTENLQEDGQWQN